MLYTRKGDTGTSGLFETKERLPKNHPIYESLGTVDELNSLLGMCRTQVSRFQDMIGVASEILRVQECLFVVQAELAGAGKSVARADLEHLEEAIGRIEEVIPAPDSFVIPGATSFSALCDYARAVSRRAERAVITAEPYRDISPVTSAYLNRLSSFLYALARYGADREGVAETAPSYEIAHEIDI